MRRKSGSLASVYSPRKQNRTALIVNPNSCSGLTGKNWDDLYARISSIVGDNSKVIFSKRTGDGTTIARNLLKRGFTRIVAIGGDGTINEVANGFFEETPAFRSAGRLLIPKPINPGALMGIVPCGTRNVLVKSLGLPQGVVECCENFVRGSSSKMDVIAVSATNSENGQRLPFRIFLNAAEMGIGAEIIDRSKKIRSKLKSRIVSTATAIMATLPIYESNICHFFIDGRRKSLSMTMGVVANGKYLGGGFMAAPEANVADGFLDIVVIKDSGSLKMLDELVNVKTGSYAGERNILYTKARKLVIKPKERKVTVTVDGEPIGVLPATFQVLPSALTVAK